MLWKPAVVGGAHAGRPMHAHGAWMHGEGVSAAVTGERRGYCSTGRTVGELVSRGGQEKEDCDGAKTQTEERFWFSSLFMKRGQMVKMMVLVSRQRGKEKPRRASLSSCPDGHIVMGYLPSWYIVMGYRPRWSHCNGLPAQLDRKCTTFDGRGLEGALECKTRARRRARMEDRKCTTFDGRGLEGTLEKNSDEGSKARSNGGKTRAQRRARMEGSKAFSNGGRIENALPLMVEGSKARSNQRRGLKGALEWR
ncbi:hypothetical protein NC652_027228 [Populus alba x Populus x berolinensis]|nr:hypothetical protein NC652_027228 [Populus alba x Populus x berolinensis]